MGIASTLIIVRSALGIAIKDEQSFRATVLQEPGAATAPGWISSVIDIRRRRDSVEGTEDEEGRAVAAENPASKTENTEARV
ncbi:hypothetical protein V5O48_010815 [Marasmius crinis-equi]|uniref:Uncharacterized protein n=1 Tax=Marasmius crinis-equi TaxID=585013 RepID=A0ABR3F7A2_9AGAR